MKIIILLSPVSSQEMNLLTKDFQILNRKFSAVAILWFLMAALGALLKIRLGHEMMSNYIIFRNVYWHSIHRINLYFIYPSEHVGSYLYGPLFSVLIAPFSILPVNAGAFLWCIFNAVVLFLAIRYLPVDYKDQQLILLLCLVEMMTCIENMQVNCLVAALIIFSFTFVQQQKDFYAAFFIATGFLLKLYGIVGIVFFLFSNNKLTFIISFISWLLVLFFLPMLISSPSFVMHSYSDWYQTLVEKNSLNNDSVFQNISVMGMLHHILNIKNINSIILAIASLFYLIPLFRKQLYSNITFRLSYLSFALIGVVIFSSSAESPTYIIAMTGACLWFSIQHHKNWKVITLIIFALCFTSLSATDFFPSFIRSNFIRPYSLKALPVFFIWLALAYQLLTKSFNHEKGVEKKSMSA